MTSSNSAPAGENGPVREGDTPSIPVRMINEYIYCPRLAYLEWVQGEWRDSADTVEGRHRHSRIDAEKDKKVPSGPESPDEEIVHSTSLSLHSEALGISAKLDLAELHTDFAVPVDYKRGKRPHVAGGAYDPERVQLCAQGLLLEEHGYRCAHGILYYAASRERVKVEFDQSLRDQTIAAIRDFRRVAEAATIPPPLVDSPKCPRCSLVSICLPDEVGFLAANGGPPRTVAVPEDDALPFYLQTFRGSIRKKGEELEVQTEEEQIDTVRLADVSQVVLMGTPYVSTPTLHELMRREIPVSWYSFGGWFLGHTVGTGHKNVEIRTAQYRASFDDEIALRLSRLLVASKIANQRTLLRRNWKSDSIDPTRPLEEMKRRREDSDRCESLSSLLGIEGAAAAEYFGHFQDMVSQQSRLDGFNFEKRNRRPPTDPINALLSFSYALLVRAWSVCLSAIGLDPYRGYYHQPRYGRPALALDMMEPFRPLVADSAVLTAINNGEIHSADFMARETGIALKSQARKRFIEVFERRLAQEVTHPLFEYSVSYRRLFELQGRLLARFLMGEIPTYPSFETR